MSNKAVLDKGFKKFQAIKSRYFQMALKKAGERIGDYIIETGMYSDVTGNTRASVAFAVYYGGSPLTIAVIDPSASKQETLKKGDVYKFADGGIFKAPTGRERYRGDQAAIQFLRGYKANGSGFSIVFCVGVKYAEYLENVRKVNVMTDAFNHVKTMGESFITQGMTFSLHNGALPFGDVTDFEIPF